MRSGSTGVTSCLLGFAVIGLAPGPCEGHAISGRITDEAGQGVAGVVVSGNKGAGTAVSRGDGFYSVRTPDNWTGVVTPQHRAFTFTPASRSYERVSSDRNEQDFTARHEPVRLAGRVLTTTGLPIQGIRIVATGTDGWEGQTAECLTNEQGQYELKLPYRWTGRLTPEHPYLRFEPTTLECTELGNAETEREIKAFPNNTKPTAKAVQVSTAQDTPVTITLTAEDPDAQDITFRITSGPQHGKAGLVKPLPGTPTRSATFAYTPMRGYRGPDTVVITPSDGTQDGDPVIVSIRVGPDGSPSATKPAVKTEAQNLRVRTNEDVPLTITLAAQAPASGDIHFRITAGPEHGKAGKINLLPGKPPRSATLLYTPDPDYNGPDRLVVTPGHDNTDGAPITVEITVLPVNDPPVARTLEIQIPTTQKAATQSVTGHAGRNRQELTVRWPTTLLTLVRGTKQCMAFFSNHSLMGVPADWPVRFIMLGGLYLALQSRLSRRYALAITMLIFLGTELFELFAIRDPLHPLSPDWGDIGDILSGLSGITAAELLARKQRTTK